MKPYGIPRVLEVEFPDVADIKRFGFKSSIGRVKTKGGDIPSYFKNSNAKRNIRRIWKKKARLNTKRELREYIKNNKNIIEEN